MGASGDDIGALQDECFRYRRGAEALVLVRR
jgi:hypothetical protein